MPLAWGTGVALALAALTALAPVSGRGASDVYTVGGVGVDVTAESAADAREQGIRAARRKAFERLIGRMVPRERHDAVPTPRGEDLKQLVRGFEISESKTSGVRYIGTLRFTFQRAAVRELLRRRQIPFAETRSKPVVVLAVYGARANPVLWADPNPWRRAWGRMDSGRGLVPFAVPLGDLADIQAISAEQALRHARDPLRAVADNHGARDALVAQAVPAGTPEAGTLSARFVASRVLDGDRAREIAFTQEQREDESRKAFYDRAAARVARRIEERWKRANLLDFQQRHTLVAEAPVRTLAQWVRIEDRLQGVPLVERIGVRRLRRSGVRLRLGYYGEPGQLATAMAQNGLQLLPPGGGAASVIRLGGSVAPPALEAWARGGAS